MTLGEQVKQYRERMRLFNEWEEEQRLKVDPSNCESTILALEEADCETSSTSCK